MFIPPVSDLTCPVCRTSYVFHEHPVRRGVYWRRTCECRERQAAMLETLQKVMRDRLPGLLSDPKTQWNTLDVLYEDPHVERLWIQLEENRLYLHRIYPCEKAFFHPHPWPSAIHILTGQYEMLLGQGSPVGAPPTPCARLILVGGSSYDMSEPSGWHSVRPFGGPSLSVMVTGRPWVMPSMEHPKMAANRPLSEAVTADLLGEFRRLLVPAGPP